MGPFVPLLLSLLSSPTLIALPPFFSSITDEVSSRLISVYKGMKLHDRSREYCNYKQHHVKSLTGFWCSVVDPHQLMGFSQSIVQHKQGKKYSPVQIRLLVQNNYMTHAIYIVSNSEIQTQTEVLSLVHSIHNTALQLMNFTFKATSSLYQLVSHSKGPQRKWGQFYKCC